MPNPLASFETTHKLKSTLPSISDPEPEKAIKSKDNDDGLKGQKDEAVTTDGAWTRGIIVSLYLLFYHFLCSSCYYFESTMMDQMIHFYIQ